MDALLLENGKLDWVLGYFPEAPLHIDREPLYTDQAVFVTHQSRSIFTMQKRVTLAKWLDYPLIMVSSRHDPLNRQLERSIVAASLRANVSIVVPHSLIALLSLNKNHYITHTLKRIAIDPTTKRFT